MSLLDSIIQTVSDADMDLLSVTKPVFLPILAPAKATLKNSILILNHFFVPFRASDPEAKLRNQAVHLMRKYETKMLIIDEIHNCLTGSAKLLPRNGLRYFHQLPYDALKIKTEMITEIEDGFTVVLNGQYWLPKTQ